MFSHSQFDLLINSVRSTLKEEERYCKYAKSCFLEAKRSAKTLLEEKDFQIEMYRNKLSDQKLSRNQWLTSLRKCNKLRVLLKKLKRERNGKQSHEAFFKVSNSKYGI